MAVKKGGAVLCLTGALEAKRGFRGFAVGQARGAGGAVAGFVDKRAYCFVWPQASGGEAERGWVASRAKV